MRIQIAFIVALLMTTTQYCEAKPSFKKVVGKLGICTEGSKFYICTKSGKTIPKKAAGSRYSQLIRALKQAKVLGAKLRNNGLSVIPDLSEAAGTNSSASLLLKPIRQALVSGNPPTLSEIASGDPATIFWTSGVIDAVLAGNATESQCNDIYNGQVSGGFGACYMAQNVGYSTEHLLQAGVSSCYMKNITTVPGLISLISGSFPSGDPKKLFSVPPGNAPRLIKISISGFSDPNQSDQDNGNERGGDSNESQVMFIKIYSQQQNSAAGNRYRYDMYDCRSSGATSYESTYVKENGLLSFESGELRYSSSVKAYLTTSSGEVVFDPRFPRKITTSFKDSNTNFKSDVTIGSDNTIKLKQFDRFDGQTRYSYNVSSYTGEDISSLRFLAGAYKEISSKNGVELYSFSGATEFRDTFYASTPGSELANSLDSISFTEDPFYASLEAPNFDGSDFNCTAQPDIVVSVDMSGEAAKSIVLACENLNITGMDFCRSSKLRQLEEKYFSTCTKINLLKNS